MTEDERTGLTVPDVVAQELTQGVAALRAAGIENISVVETKPPRALAYAGVLRIVRQRRLAGSEIELVVARESYQ